ncbi:hypothetical protein BGZ99_001054 [Dissophora globulifera]|uniref:ACB domain-containing protein n=1 Tax=Dissophora globulifera TaxID=979702 RepID=A0A9P6UKT6_9FUNG|nr:hypothetical protein BGZ99_001054 [Dissophora globulifera]
MLQARFDSASAFMASAKKLKLPSSTKLALYADYKIATEGLCTQPRPSMIEFEKSAKWKAWTETGERYVNELKAAAQVATRDEQEDAARLELPILAMVSYIERVEGGQWGWKFDPTESNAGVTTTGDQDLDELEAYLGTDMDEISAEEMLARPFVPVEGHMEGPATAGISTMAFSTEDDTGYDPLEPAKSGSVEALQSALTNNPELISLKDDMGFTMLHWACDRGSLEKVKLLIETYNVDVNVQDADGQTPLHCASLADWPAVVAYLKSLPSVDQSIKDNSGMTAEECLE